MYFCHGRGEGSGSWIQEWGGLDGVGDEVWVAAIKYHEWAFTRGRVDPVVVGKLGNGKPVTPVSLSVGDEKTKVSFEFLVNSLGLPVGLWVEGG